MHSDSSPVKCEPKVAAMIVGLALLVIVVVFALPLARGIWLPDVVTARKTILGQVATPDGNRFQVVQHWVGDGYLTEFNHTDKRGTVWEFTMFGDGKKAWQATIQLKTQNVVGIVISGDTFSYNPDTHKALDGAGRSRYVLEIPLNGSPAFLLESNTTP